MSEKNCESSTFWEELIKGYKVGECKRHAPQVATDAVMRDRVKWTRTAIMDLCSEYKQTKTPKTTTTGY